MKIIVGLGNPEKKHEKTRHNLGFSFLDFLENSQEFPEFENSQRFEALTSKKGDWILVKPQTYMNLSGKAIRNILDFYKLSSEDVLVVHDDIDIEAGKYKLTFDSSSAGHNGIKDIIEKLGTQKFSRVRIGIKNESLRNPYDPADFVLQNFEEKELKNIQALFPKIEKEIFKS